MNAVIIDDHELFREGLALLLKKLNLANNVYQFDNGKQFIKTLNGKYEYDIIFMDIDMPLLSGHEVAKRTLEIDNSLKIIAISMHKSTNKIKQMYTAGCKGYLTKNSSFKEIDIAIERVFNGQNYTSQDAIVLSPNCNATNIGINIPFTNRELEIIHNICDGITSSEIAQKLKISKRTVDKHRENISTKAGVNSSAELVRFCINNNII